MIVARRTLFRCALATTDVITLTAALAAADYLDHLLFPSRTQSTAGHGWLVILIISCWLLSLASAGLYTSAAFANTRHLSGRMSHAAGLVAVVSLFCLHIAGGSALAERLLGCCVLVGGTALMAERLVLRTLLDYFRNRDPGRGQVLLIGTAERAMNYLYFVGAHESLNIEVVGFLDPRDASIRAAEFEPD